MIQKRMENVAVCLCVYARNYYPASALWHKSKTINLVSLIEDQNRFLLLWGFEQNESNPTS